MAYLILVRMNLRRRALVFLLLAAVLLFAFFVRTWWLDQRAGVSAYVATRLKRTLSADPRFARVAVRRKFEEVAVLAPDSLQASDRTDLQRIVTEQSKPLDVHVFYFPAADISTTPSP